MNQIDCKQAQNVWSRVMAAQAGAQSTSANPPVQPAMDLSRDKNAEEMKWSPLEMGAAMQAHGA